ncbi:MAG: lysine exporter LysO family protein [Spirochaetales bacterium]|nr:MAG: lysine exporter LysO family protein [Spirochaetales bacterium]
MRQLVTILTFIGSLAAGMLVARIKFVSRFRFTGQILMICLYVLLFFMGFRLGRNDNVVSSLGSVGALSLAFAAATAAGTAMALFLGYVLFFRKKKPGDSPEGAGTAGNTAENNRKNTLLPLFREPLKLFFLVVAGFCAGFFIPVFPGFKAEKLTSYVLYVLLFLVGVDMVKSGVNLKQSLLQPETIFLPLGTVIGSLAGGLLLKVVLVLAGGGRYLPNLHLNEVLALSAGFGWYSLSGVIITNLGDPVLGSVGFMSNLFRESIALLTIPLIARTRYPRIGIGVAGATSMDVTLPLIERSCGPSAVPQAITSGAVLSLLVPLLVPVFYNL